VLCREELGKNVELGEECEELGEEWHQSEV